MIQHPLHLAKRAFSLVEMAMVVAIAGLMVGFAMQAQKAASPECYPMTKQQMVTIKAAIEQFAKKNDRFPMPAARNIAPDNINYGREAGGANVDAAAGVSFGALPFQTLGLGPNFAGDCWGNKLSYAVTTALTSSPAPGGYLDPTVLGNITVNSGSGNALNTQAAWAVISHGEDGLGAVKLGYSAANAADGPPDSAHKWCSGATLKYTNCKATAAVLVDAVFNNGANAGANYYDDVIVAASKNFINSALPASNAYAWGYNSNGQIGDNTTTQRNVPTAVSGGLTFTQVTGGVGTQMCGLTAAGAAYCWGGNASGQVGDGTTTERHVPTAVTGGLTFTQIGIGSAVACGLTSAGAAYCWGDNTHGAVGDGTTTQRLVPTAVGGGHVFTSISVSYQDVCGVDTMGAAYCWGYNNNGQVGDGTTTQRTTPTAVSGGLSFVQVSANGGLMCGLTSTGTAYCWGANTWGQIGDGTTTQRSVPTLVSGGLTFVKLSTGVGTACGLTASGAAYCWGYNTYGQLGDGTTTNRSVPTAVSGGLSFVDIQPGSRTCGLLATGTAYCWGKNNFGQVGDNTTTNRSVPTLVSGGQTFMQISGDQVDTIALPGTPPVTADLYGWGDNSASQIGDGTTVEHDVPTKTAAGFSFTQVSASQANNYFSCGLTATGAAYCWGKNNSGRLGDGTSTSRNVPTAVSGGLTFSRISTGGSATCGLTTAGAAYCWGNNANGQVGDGTTTSRNVPTAVTGGLTFTRISAGENSACGITPGGVAYCWGDNTYGQLGDGTTTQSLAPTAVTGGILFKSIHVSKNVCGIATDGTTYCWGLNSSGQLGDGTTTNRKVPTAVTGGLTFKFVQSGATSCGLTTTGTAYCWGDNANGEIGDGTTTQRTAPTAVQTGLTFAVISPGTTSTCALTAIGNAYCWGLNTTGQLGNGTTTQSLVPWPLAGNYHYSTLSEGNIHGLGIIGIPVADGSAYGWGYNSTGQIGDNTTTNRYVPTVVSGGLIFTQVANGGTHSCGITAAGKAYCWGGDSGLNYGEIGDGTTTQRNVPTAVSGGLTFKQISAGGYRTCAITTAGAGYCWGDNTWGTIGDGTGTNRLVPTAVSGGLVFTQLSTGSLHSCGLTTSGAAYCWGRNVYSQLGEGGTTGHSTPKAVSGGLAFAQVSTGAWHSCGLTITGAAYCWGRNQVGQVGDTTTTNRATPTAVSGGLIFAQIHAGNDHTCALTATGEAYCWGTNAQGQLGDGTTTQRNTPTAVTGGLTFTQISANNNGTCGLTAAGAAYCWGYNNYGTLGDGTTTSRSVPTLVAGGLTFSQLTVGGGMGSHVLGIIGTPPTPGTPYGWGPAANLGTNTASGNYSTPVSVMLNKTFTQVVGGIGHTCGLTSAGAAYCAGDNTYGQIGDNTNTTRLLPVAVSGGYTFTKIVAGDYTTCGLTSAGAMYCWGYNNHGQIGDGSTTNRKVPTVVSGGLVFSDIGSGGYNSCGMTATGAIYCWGYNNVGQAGDNTGSDHTTPSLVIGGITFAKLSVGAAASCGLTSAGKAYCWGWNTSGQLGNNSTTSSGTPVTVSGGLTFKSLSVGYQTTCGLTTAGAAYCWGTNADGEIGDGTTTQRNVPTAVTGGLTFTQINTGNTSVCALTPIGAAYCWGNNASNSLGDGTTTQRNVPTAVSGGLTFSMLAPNHVGPHMVGLIGTPPLTGNAYGWGGGGAGDLGNNSTADSYTPTPTFGGLTFTQISAHWAISCGLTATGKAYCWGWNGDGAVGDGTTTDRLLPTAVSGGLTFSQISVGDDLVCAVTLAGSAYCWGGGGLGNGSNSSSSVPVAVSGGLTFSQVSVGINNSACGITTTGAAYCWGSNGYGQLGDGTTTQRLSPVAVSGGLSFSQISLGDNQTCGITTTGAAYCWGQNSFGALGDGTTTNRLVPTAVSGGLTFAQIALGNLVSCGLTTTGTAYCWGANGIGQVGDGSGTDKYVPTAVAGGLTFNQISAGDLNACGLTPLGKAYCWGDNHYGAIGDGTVGTFGWVPVPVKGNLTFSQISAGGYHTAGIIGIPPALPTNAWAWGDNSYGELGDGTTTQRNVPTNVSGGVQFTQVSGGQGSNCGLTAAGAAYCWGANGFGQIGDGTTTQRLVPTAVSGGLVFNQISTNGHAASSHTCGITNAGAAYCWGDNNNGELGDGTTTDRLVPTAVSGGLVFSSISVGEEHTCAITTAGVAYCWGRNDAGNIGDGTTTARSVPTAVTGGLTFVQISAGHFYTCAITTAGAAYCWGVNTNGGLGDGTTTQRLVPTAVSGGRTFVQISTGLMTGGWGQTHTCGISSAGAAYCWGQNAWGQIGDGTTTQRLVPTAVSGGQTFVQVNSGSHHSCGITSAGVAYCWGWNGSGSLGDNTITDRLVPTAVYGGKTFSQMDAGDLHMIAIKGIPTNPCPGGGVKIGNSSYCWYLGASSASCDTACTAVGANYNTATLSVAGSGGTNANCSGVAALLIPGAAAAITSGGAGVGCEAGGTNIHRSTTATTSSSTLPGHQRICACTLVPVAGACGTSNGGDFSSAPSTNLCNAGTPSVVTGGAGSAWSWTCNGLNGGGNASCSANTACAAGTYTWLTNCSAPVTQQNNGYSASLTNTAGGFSGSTTLACAQGVWSDSGGSCSAATATNLFCWGNDFNSKGALANGSTGGQVFVPTQASGTLQFTSIVGGEVGCGLIADGTAYCWGDNTYGTLGDGTTTSRNVPTAVNTVQKFASLWPVGSYNMCGLLSDGTLYCWGKNEYGQLGDNTTTQRNSPVAASTTAKFTKIIGDGDTVCALATDAQVYCWGNSGTEIGRGLNPVNPNTPTAIPTRRAAKLESNPGQFCLITSAADPSGAGNLYCWGWFGNNSVSQNIIPIPVATYTITGITKAANALITTSASHGLNPGDKVYIDEVAGMIQINNPFSYDYTNSYKVMTTPTSTTFTINLNTTGYSAYTSGGRLKVMALATPALMSTPGSVIDFFGPGIKTNDNNTWMRGDNGAGQLGTGTAVYTDWYRKAEPANHKITAITRANPAVVTTAGAHGFTNGTRVLITGTGMATIEGAPFIVTNATATTFQLYYGSAGSNYNTPANTSADSAYGGLYGYASPFPAIDTFYDPTFSGGETYHFSSMTWTKAAGGPYNFTQLYYSNPLNMGLTAGNQLYVWGMNWMLDCGGWCGVGDGTSNNRGTPVLANVPGGVTPKTLLFSDWAPCFLSTTDALYCWGSDADNGGIPAWGSNTGSKSPVAASGGLRYLNVVALNHTTYGPNTVRCGITY